MDRLKPCAAMKDSGVPWLGRVPEQWQVRRLKWCVALNPKRNEALSSVSRDTLVTFLPMECVSADGKADVRQQVAAATVWNGFTHFQRGDVLLAKITPCFENGKGAWLDGLPTEFGFGSTEFHVLRAGRGVLPQFVYYATTIDEFRRLGAGAMTGAAGQQRVPESFVANFEVGLPPPEEQAAIVRFLDHATRRIGKAIRAKQKLVKLLEEEKQAIIHRAVTRGLDPNVRLKPSGVEWLGDVPEHWQVRRLKTVARIRYGLGQPPKESSDGLPLIRATNIDNGRIVEKDLITVDPDDVPATRDAILKADEIIVVRSGAYTADSAIIPSAYSGAVAGYDMVATPFAVRPAFLAFALLSSYVRDDQLITASMRSAQPHLNKEELGTALIFLPPPDEQSAIEEQIKTALNGIDSALDREERGIGLLREYRTRLIADVVTGKLDVRAAAAELPDEPDDAEPLEDVDAADDTADVDDVATEAAEAD